MIFRRLLPIARAWRVTVDKQLRQFTAAFDILETEAKAFLDSVYLDLFPASTRQLDQWEFEFGLPTLGLSEAERRDRVAAAWIAVGGQSPRYIQDTLQASGFDVYVHDAWEPGTEPPNGTPGAATYRNPLTYLQQTYPGISPGVNCGQYTAPFFAACGEVTATCGNQIAPLGYPLVNKVPDTARVVSADSATWPFYLYIGGEVFGTMAQVDPIRRDEFEALCLKLDPAQLWLGIMVEY